MHLFVQRQVGRHIHSQPIGPFHERYPNLVSIHRGLLHPRYKVVHVLVHDRLQGPQEPSAERRGDPSGHVAMPDGILFPDEATEVLAAVLEIGLDEVLQVLVLRRVDVGEGLGRKESEFIGRDSDYRPVLVHCLLNCPGPPSGKPVVGIPDVGNGGECRPWEMGQWMKVQ